MGLKCGLVGLPFCGKTTIYNAITAANTTGIGSGTNRAVVNIPDGRIQKLVDIYHPAKVVPATLELIDIPGIKPNSTAADGYGNKLLGQIKDVDMILHVVQCFNPGSVNPRNDIETIDLEMMVADSQTLQNKITRLAKKAKFDKEVTTELGHCEKVKSGLDQGIPARRQNLNEDEMKSIYECFLLSIKPVLYIANTAEASVSDRDYLKTINDIALNENSQMITICGRDENDIAQLDPADRPEFLKALGLTESSVERLLQAARAKLIVTFFTVGEDEVRAWTCRKGDKAPVAAGRIHSDMERGFVRMEVFDYDDLIELGSESAVTHAGKKRVEGKNYEVKEGDIVFVLFNANR